MSFDYPAPQLTLTKPIGREVCRLYRAAVEWAGLMRQVFKPRSVEAYQGQGQVAMGVNQTPWAGETQGLIRVAAWGFPKCGNVFPRKTRSCIGSTWLAPWLRAILWANAETSSFDPGGLPNLFAYPQRLPPPMATAWSVFIDEGRVWRGMESQAPGVRP